VGSDKSSMTADVVCLLEPPVGLAMGRDGRVLERHGPRTNQNAGRQPETLVTQPASATLLRKHRPKTARITLNVQNQWVRNIAHAVGCICTVGHPGMYYRDVDASRPFDAVPTFKRMRT
jgi:hypothetical protein